MKHNEKILFYSAVLGLLALLVGALGLYTNFGYWIKESEVSGSEHFSPGFAYTLAYWSGGAGIILCEMLISLCFVLLSLLLFRFIGLSTNMKGNFIAIGFFRLALSIIMFSSFFKPGWYYVLGSEKYGVFVLLFGVLQGAVLFFGKKDAVTNEIKNPALENEKQ